MLKPKRIEEVLNELDAIVQESIKTNSRHGLFAYVYWRTTLEIASEIAKGNFEDNQRLEILDVAFANLYLDAYKAYKNNQKLSASWTFAFENIDAPLAIIQHILLGMNTHINLDLAVATASTMSGQPIQDIENDYNKVNDILFQITNELQDRLSRVSPLLFIADLLGKSTDEKLINFSMRKARKQAWNSANLLWALEEGNRKKAIDKIDFVVLQLGKQIKSPKTVILKFVLQFIQIFETKNISKIISKLKLD